MDPRNDPRYLHHCEPREKRRSLERCTAYTGIAALTSAANATVIWTEDFEAYSDGDAITGSTATGSGTFNNFGTVAANATGQALLTADGGRDTLQVDSLPPTAAGILSFNVVFLGDASPMPNDTDVIFIQMTVGGRSTNPSPIQNLTHTIDAGADAISGDPLNPSKISHYFNGSSSPMSYTGLDSTPQTIAPGSYDYWVDTLRVDNDNTNSSNMSTPPATVSTILAQTFNSLNGESWTFDDMQFESIAVPEPSSATLLGLSILGLGLVRRRK